MIRRACLPDKSIVQGDLVDRAGPDEERVGRVGSALVAVTAAFDDQTQLVFAREVDCGNDVFGFCGGDGKNARGRGSCIDPAQRLRQGRVVTDVVWVFEFGEEFAARFGV